MQTVHLILSNIPETISKTFLFIKESYYQPYLIHYLLSYMHISYQSIVIDLIKLLINFIVVLIKSWKFTEANCNGYLFLIDYRIQLLDMIKYHCFNDLYHIISYQFKTVYFILPICSFYLIMSCYHSTNCNLALRKKGKLS